MSVADGGLGEASSRWVRARSASLRWTRSLGVTLLVIDSDDEGESAFVEELAYSGVSATWCSSPLEALVLFGRVEPAAVVLAQSFNDISSVEMVKVLKDYGAKMLLVGADATDAEGVGPLLAAGATAAVARPYQPQEILARLSSLALEFDVGRLTFGPLELDAQAYDVRIAGRPLAEVPLKEFELLRVLMTHADTVVPTETIRKALWGDDEISPTSNAVAVHIAKLRALLADHARVIRVRGRGYRLVIDP
jgi:two-component system OmpR family response regulator